MRVVVTQERTEAVEPVRRILLSLGLECGPADCVSFTQLPVRLAQSPVDLVLVRVGADVTSAQSAIRQTTALTTAPIFALGHANDVQPVLQTTRSGAREYLDEANLQMELELALESLKARGSVRPEQGLTVSVVSATPGSGVTTVAANLAFTWAERYPERVTLIELGREAADLALSLDLDPRHTVGDVAENWQRLDSALLRQSMVTHPQGVAILAHHPDTLITPTVLPEAVRKMVILLRTMYAATVLDLGHTLGEEHFEAMRLSDRIATVVRLDVPSLRRARQFLQQATERGVPMERIRLIANRYGQKGQVSWRKAEEALGNTFTGYIPEDVGKLNYSLNQGMPLVKAAPHSGISRRFAKLATLMNGHIPH